MIKFVCEVLDRDEYRIGVIEAGTGTGKTIAYCIPAALAAKRAGKKLVVVTSTVLLQDQLISGELLDLAGLDGLNLRVGLLKGRTRYACLKRLDTIQTDESDDGNLGLIEDDPLTSRDKEIASELVQKFESHAWDGDMDTSPVKLSPKQVNRFTTGSLGCYGRVCTFFESCPYYTARDTSQMADVIVTNYHLLLSSQAENVDLLPPAEQCIYVFDEAHRMLDIVPNHAAKSAGTQGLADLTNRSLELFTKLRDKTSNESPIGAFVSRAFDLKEVLTPTIDSLNNRYSDYASKSRTRYDPNYVFERGLLDDGLVTLTESVATRVAAVCDLLQEGADVLTEARDENQTWIRKRDLDRSLISLSLLRERGRTILDLARDWSHPEARRGARWITKVGDDIRMHSVPVDIDEQLTKEFWNRAFGVICASATLYASDGLTQFARLTGLQLNKSNTLRLASPFNTKENAVIQFLDTNGLVPTDARFKSFAAKELPQLLSEDRSALVLFTSRATLDEVFYKLPATFKRHCLNQIGSSVVDILEQHRKRIEANERSYIFGTESFREGIDLPGKLCEHVVVMRIPFPVPSDPVLKTQKEFLELDNDFFEFDIPIASRRLYQTVGRLLRSETDTGKISILDRRPLERNYYKQLLKPLDGYQIYDRAS